MRKFIILSIFLVSLKSFCQINYPQKLIFDHKDVGAFYVDQYGKKKIEQISDEVGFYQISFSRATEIRNSPILDISGDTAQDGYYVYMSTLNNIKWGGRLYEVNTFYSTSLDSAVEIYLAYDKSCLMISTKSKLIRYFLMGKFLEK